MAKAVLRPDLEDCIETLIEKSDEEYEQGDFLNSIKTLEEAWHKLPEPKGDYSESYHIVMGISETYLLLKDYQKAGEWSEILYNCALHRIDSGEREFLSGKIAFESGDLEKAKDFFAIACRKSDGRCFEDVDRKYYRCYKKK